MKKYQYVLFSVFLLTCVSCSVASKNQEEEKVNPITDFAEVVDVQLEENTGEEVIPEENVIQDLQDLFDEMAEEPEVVEPVYIDECLNRDECESIIFGSVCLKSSHPEITGYKSLCTLFCGIDENAGQQYVFTEFGNLEGDCVSLLDNGATCCGMAQEADYYGDINAHFCLPPQSCCYDNYLKCGEECCPEDATQCTKDGKKCLKSDEIECDDGTICPKDSVCLKGGDKCCKIGQEICGQENNICCSEGFICHETKKVCLPKPDCNLVTQTACKYTCCPEDQVCAEDEENCEPKCTPPAPTYCKNECCANNEKCVGEENGGFCKPIGADYCGFINSEHRFCSSAQKCLNNLLDKDKNDCASSAEDECLLNWDQEKCCVPWDANCCPTSPKGHCLATEEKCLTEAPYCCSTNTPVPCGDKCCLGEEKCITKLNGEKVCAIGNYCPEWDIICSPGQECNKCKSGCKQIGLEDCCEANEGYCLDDGYYCTHDNPSCCKNETVACKGKCCLYGEECFVPPKNQSIGICYDPNEDEVCYDCGKICPAEEKCMKNLCQCILDDEVDCGLFFTGSTNYCGFGEFCVKGPQKCCKNGQKKCGSICCKASGSYPDTCGKYDDGDDVCITYGYKKCKNKLCGIKQVCCKGNCYPQDSTCCGLGACSSDQQCCDKKCIGLKDICCPTCVEWKCTKWIELLFIKWCVKTACTKWQGHHKCSQSKKCCGNSCAPVDGKCCSPTDTKKTYWGCQELEECCGDKCMPEKYSCCGNQGYAGWAFHCSPQYPVCVYRPDSCGKTSVSGKPINLGCCQKEYPNPCSDCNTCCK